MLLPLPLLDARFRLLGVKEEGPGCEEVRVAGAATGAGVRCRSTMPGCRKVRPAADLPGWGG